MKKVSFQVLIIKIFLKKAIFIFDDVLFTEKVYYSQLLNNKLTNI
jgi:hypothetical protein